MPSSINSSIIALEMATHIDAALAKQVGDQSEFHCPIPSQTTQWMTTKFEINDLNAAGLMFLTNKSVQNDIEQSSGTIVATCGRYMAFKEKNQASSEEPLHLFIQGPKEQNLEFAINKIQSYIQQAKCVSIYPNLTSSSLISDAEVEKVLIGLDVPLSFDLKNKILGSNGANLQNIMNKTGATVTMKGQGSGFIEVNGQESVEPLHLRIEHDKNEVLKKSRHLAFNLIKTVKNKLNSSYAASHLASQFNVVYPPSNTTLQHPLVYPKYEYVQTNKSQKLQINPTHYQIVQIGTQNLEDRSQTVQTSVANYEIPISPLNSVSQIVAVFPTITQNRLQLQQFQGLSHIASIGQHQAIIKPQLLTQVATQNQQQLPFSITLENIENDQYTPSVTNTGSNLLANDVMPHSVASMTQSTIPIEYIQIPNDQIIVHQPPMQSIDFETVQTPHSGQSNQLLNSNSIGTSYLMDNQMVQYQQPSGHPGQVMIMQCQQLPITETQMSTVQPIYLHQIQSEQLNPANTPNDQLTLQQTFNQPTQLQMIIPQPKNQFQNLQPQIIHNYSDVIQSQVISQTSTQQLQPEYEDKQFTQHIIDVSNNQLGSLPVSYYILPQENVIVTITLPQQQQLRLQNQQIQTQITNKQIICKEEDDQSVIEMIPQGQQQSVQYFQLNNQFQSQPFDQSHVIALKIGEISGAKLKQAELSQIISNYGSDNNRAWQMTVNDIVGTMSTEKHAVQTNLKNQSATGNTHSINCINIDAKDLQLLQIEQQQQVQQQQQIEQQQQVQQQLQTTSTYQIQCPTPSYWMQHGITLESANITDLVIPKEEQLNFVE